MFNIVGLTGVVVGFVGGVGVVVLSAIAVVCRKINEKRRKTQSIISRNAIKRNFQLINFDNEIVHLDTYLFTSIANIKRSLKKSINISILTGALVGTSLPRKAIKSILFYTVSFDNNCRFYI